MTEYVLKDEVITDLEDISDELSELGTAIGDNDFESTVSVLDRILETLKEIRVFLAEHDKNAGEESND